ncbi:MAG: hypothetical protein OXF05_05340 [Hyphomicrobiales bacterium]|nr:hypothetical protein [Hyphomicrobiales bacterium]MCY4032819.1 hypothetical protein [Hyphomicrobiales bacterium]MCY4039116.1 hypothetical protein [Hyphomicrobiales bacterium]
MKTLVTTLAFALMVFAFNAGPTSAQDSNDAKKVEGIQVIHGKMKEPVIPVDLCKGIITSPEGLDAWKERCPNLFGEADPQDQDNDRDFADSGDEGFTSEVEMNFESFVIGDDTSDTIGREEPSGSITTTKE